jgi:hypothetical protein
VIQDPFAGYELAHAILGAALGIPQDSIRITGQGMCELISQFFRSRGIERTPEEIWNYSPTGELSMVFEWFHKARRWQQTYRALPAPLA